jgi:arginyl-tRNA synthetase
MSSRDGTVVLLDDLIREATQRALDVVKEKNPTLGADAMHNVAEKVALGAIKYPMIARENTKIVTFDWETALDFNGQSAPYIQYAVVRANSILRRLTEPAPSKADFSHELMPAEVNLIEKISQLPEVVQKAAADSKPSLVATYSFELAQSFNDFYTQCPVLSAEGSSRRSRLVLVQAAKVALENGLSLLGIQSPQVM